MTLNDNSPHILIVGDLALSRGLMRMVLTRLDYIVFCVGSAKEAAVAMAHNRFSLALVATRLNDGSGLAFSKQLREEGDKGRTLPVILFGDTWDEAAMDQECRSAGIQGFLNKPISISRLVDNVRRWTMAANDSFGAARDSFTFNPANDCARSPGHQIKPRPDDKPELDDRHGPDDRHGLDNRPGLDDRPETGARQHPDQHNERAGTSNDTQSRQVKSNRGQINQANPRQANLRQAQFRQALHERHCDPGFISGPSRDRNKPDKRTASLTSIIDLDHLNGFTGGDRQLEGELATLYISTARHYLAQMQDRLNKQSGWDHVAHSLKGSSANIGAQTMAALAKQAEHADPSDELLNQLQRQLDEVIAFFDQRSDAAPDEVDQKAG